MADASEIDPRLLEILVCPLTKAPLRYDRQRQELVSLEAGLAYPIRDGIPIMLVDEAPPLEDAEQTPPQKPCATTAPPTVRPRSACTRQRRVSTSPSRSAR